MKQNSISSEEAFLGSIKEEDSRSSTPTNEKIIVMESPHKKKSSARWLNPLRVTPAKEFNFFSLTVKIKPNKSRNSAEVFKIFIFPENSILFSALYIILFFKNVVMGFEKKIYEILNAGNC